ncbi:ribonuclease H-like domain-containing protein [Tanacetum coccineum]|uniref:Ribonuclease H-like domain-containing protein n=1 Tax=Tanacetum coccineum TaxID=301880 RepID=A0ABQ4WL22_9ASTR
MTRRVLLQCDSTGDLYLITTPSPIPHAFLVSQHTWHQRLGHPGSEVLRRLVSNNFIPCNKEKHPFLCHACHLGKHVRLLFVSSDTMITSCFDIIHGTNTAYLLLYVDNIMLIASSEILLQQIIPQYPVEILERAHMVSCNPSRTPIDTESKLGDDGVCLSMHDPREPHFSALKRILDWAGCPTTRRSTSGYCVFLGNNLLSCSSKYQPTLSRSSVEAEYRSVVNAVVRTCWLRNLLRKLHTPLSPATLVYCDNVSVIYLSCNLVQHQRTKHIEIDIHFVRDLVATGQVRVLYVPSRYQYATIFTKGLPSTLFEEFRTSLSVRCPPAPTTGEC